MNSEPDGGPVNGESTAVPGRTDAAVLAHVAAFFGLSYALAWAVWIPAGRSGVEAMWPVLLGAWAPTVAALAIAYATGRTAGVRMLLARLLRWRTPAWTYAIAVLGMLGVAGVALALHGAVGGPFPTLEAIAARFGIPGDRAGLFLAAAPLVYATTIFAGGPIAEELGWRGFAQARLQALMGPGPAGLAIGLVWSLWHLPLFVFYDAAVAGLPLGAYVPLVTALGVLFAWLFVRSGGSVVLAILFHASVNFTLGVLGGPALAEDRQLLLLFVVTVFAVAILAWIDLTRRGRFRTSPGM